MRDLHLDVRRPTTGVSATPYLPTTNLALDLLKHMGEIFMGTMTGTGAALDSPALPFDPAIVIIINETDLSIHIHAPSMAAGEAAEIKLAVAFTAADAITLGVKKFTLGTHANLNAAADVLHFIAIGARNLGGSA